MEIDLIDMENSDETDPKRFTWQMSSFSPNHMEIKLDFEQPHRISSTKERDRLKIQFIDTQLLFDSFG